MKSAESKGLNIIDYLLIKREFDTIKSDKMQSKQDKFIDYINKAGYGNKRMTILELMGYKVDLFSTGSGLFQ
jgi:hypothetical protein